MFSSNSLTLNDPKFYKKYPVPDFLVNLHRFFVFLCVKFFHAFNWNIIDIVSD